MTIREEEPTARWTLLIGFLAAAMLVMGGAAAANGTPAGPSEACAVMESAWTVPPLSEGVFAGTGFPGDPYQLAAPEHFVSMSDYYVALMQEGDATAQPRDSESCWSASFVVTQDVDLTSVLSGDGWNPIGISGSYVTVFDDHPLPFRGVFDGGGFTISGFRIDTSEMDVIPDAVGVRGIGFFGYAKDAVIRDVSFANPTVVVPSASDDSAEVPNRFGVLVGLGAGIDIDGVNISGSLMDVGQPASSDRLDFVGTVAGYVEDSSALRDVTVTASTVSASDNDSVGGVVGKAQIGVLMERVSFTGTVTGDNTVGGVVGYLDEGGAIVDVTVEATVSSTSGRVGGIAGEIEESRISIAQVSGSVVATGGDVGGIVGTLESSSRVEYASFEGTVSSPDGNEVGGIAGYQDDSSIADVRVDGTVIGGTYVGGITGELGDGSIMRAVATVEVSGSTNIIGGIAGEADESTVHDVSVSGTVTGQEKVGGIVGDVDDTTVTQAVANVDVTGTVRVGGVFGEFGDSIVRFGVATGTITGDTEVGGVSGRIDSGQLIEVGFHGDVVGLDQVGGVVGKFHNPENTVAAYAIGTVSASDQVGGFLGYAEDPAIVEASFVAIEDDSSVSTGDRHGFVGLRNAIQPPLKVRTSFWDVDVWGSVDGTPDDSTDGMGLVTGDMQALATYVEAGWSIAVPGSDGFGEATWGLCEGTTYPFLVWVLDSSVALEALGGLEAYAPCAVEDGRSSNAALRGVSVDGASLSPAFDADTVEYALTFDPGADGVTLFVTADDPAASVSVNEVPLGNGGSVTVPAQDDGSLAIVVVVTAEDGSTRQYDFSGARSLEDGPINEDAEQGVLIVPDDGAAWIVFAPNHPVVDNYEVKVNGGAWRPYEPAVKRGPLFVGSLTNGEEAVVVVRAIVNGEYTSPSSSFAVTPRVAEAPAVGVKISNATAEVTVLRVAAGRATIRVSADLTNEGEDVLASTWVRPSVSTGEVLAVRVQDPGDGVRVEQLGDAWFLDGLALAVGASVTLELDVVTEVQ